MKIKILLSLIMLWCTFVASVHSTETAETDCTDIANGTAGAGEGSGSGSGSGGTPSSADR